MDPVFPPTDLARTPSLLRAQTEMHRVQHGIPVLRKRQDDLNFEDRRYQFTRRISSVVSYRSYADRSPLGTIGRLLRRTPVASKMALPMAGATAMIGVSPAPAEGISLRSSKTASISGTSRKRGTR